MRIMFITIEHISASNLLYKKMSSLLYYESNKTI